jgi:hypothetical protein
MIADLVKDYQVKEYSLKERNSHLYTPDIDVIKRKVLTIAEKHNSKELIEFRNKARKLSGNDFLTWYMLHTRNKISPGYSSKKPPGYIKKVHIRIICSRKMTDDFYRVAYQKNTKIVFSEKRNASKVGKHLGRMLSALWVTNVAIFTKENGLWKMRISKPAIEREVNLFKLAYKLYPKKQIQNKPAKKTITK